MSESRTDVEAAVIDAYSKATGADRTDVERGLDGSQGLPFDSVVGVELMIAMDKRFGLKIPDAEQSKGKNFRSLRDFAEMVERYVRIAERQP